MWISMDMVYKMYSLVQLLALFCVRNFMYLDGGKWGILELKPIFNFLLPSFGLCIYINSLLRANNPVQI